jgi:hypothetical protein
MGNIWLKRYSLVHLPSASFGGRRATDLSPEVVADVEVTALAPLPSELPASALEVRAIRQARHGATNSGRSESQRVGIAAGTSLGRHNARGESRCAQPDDPTLQPHRARPGSGKDRRTMTASSRYTRSSRSKSGVRSSFSRGAKPDSARAHRGATPPAKTTPRSRGHSSPPAPGRL